MGQGFTPECFQVTSFPFRKGECLDFCTFFHRTKAVVIHNWIFFFKGKPKQSSRGFNSAGLFLVCFFFKGGGRGEERIAFHSPC